MAITIPSTPFTIPTIPLPPPIPGPPGPGMTGIVDASTFGTVGNGVADDTVALQNAINAAFVVTLSNTPTPPVGNKILYIPPGNYKITSPLLLTGTFGAVMMGAGRFTTQIINANGGNVITTQGCQYTMFRDMLLQTSGSGICFDLNWDGVHNCALQSNTFMNMQFGGGAQGVRIGAGGFMGSENTFVNCFFSGLSTAGISTNNFNALQNNVFGGDFQGCAIGILVNSGSVPAIMGVGFQASTTWDIDVEGAANDTYNVSGCRTESVNFIKFGRGNGVVAGCCQTAGANGVFVRSSTHPITITNCISVAGQVDLQNQGEVVCSEFGRADWATSTTVNVRMTTINGTIDNGAGTLLYGGVAFGTLIFNSYPRVVTLTDAASVNTDASLGLMFLLNINGNRTLTNPINLSGATVYNWVITQGVGGNFTLAYGNLFTWPGGVTPTLSTAAGAVDVITAVWDGVKLRASIQKGFA